jgi:uncharacterized protein (DUF433 family)
MAAMFDRITHDPEVLAGRATLRGLRISVAHVVNLVANGMTRAQIVVEQPGLDEEDVRQALAYAAAIAEDQVHPIPSGKQCASSLTRGSLPRRSISISARFSPLGCEIGRVLSCFASKAIPRTQ